MTKETIINQVVKKAYKDLTGLVDFRVAGIIGGYFGIIIHDSKLEELTPYVDDIINTLYDKFCVNLSKNITDDDMEFIIYKSFCSNKPNKDLIDAKKVEHIVSCSFRGFWLNTLSPFCRKSDSHSIFIYYANLII